MLYQILRSGKYLAESLGLNSKWFLAEVSGKQGFIVVTGTICIEEFAKPLSEWLTGDSPAWKDICKDGHSFYMQGATPDVHRNEALKTGKINTGWTYEYHCNLCSAKFFSRIKINFPKHKDCVQGSHLWTWGCTLCCPGNAHCARLCGATPLGWGCRCKIPEVK